MTKPIIIAGAGPGGLVAALALYRQGLDVALFESVTELKPLGRRNQSVTPCRTRSTRLGPEAGAR